MKKFSWQETIITITAMILLFGIFLVVALVFGTDGKVALALGLGILALANSELRNAILERLPTNLVSLRRKGKQ